MRLSEVKNAIDIYFKEMDETEFLEISKKYGIMPLLNTNVPQIEFEDYFKKQVEICEVVYAKKVPKKDKLLFLTIKTSGGYTNCITNLGGQGFIPEDFIGKKLPFVLNLKPAKIAGYDSFAMISGPESNGKYVILDYSNLEVGDKII